MTNGKYGDRWITPRKEFTFNIERMFNMIDITIKDPLGIEKFDIRFSKNDSERILEAFRCFLVEFDMCLGTSYTIEISPGNTDLIFPVIFIEVIEEGPIIMDNDIGEEMELNIRFAINKWDDINRKYISAISFLIDWWSLAELVRKIFIASKIDEYKLQEDVEYDADLFLMKEEDKC